MKKLKGSLTIEAALSLTTCIIVIFTLIYLVKVIYIHERVQYALSETAKEMVVGAYIMDKTGLLDLQQNAYSQAKGNIDQFESSFDALISSYNEVSLEMSGLTSYSRTEDEQNSYESLPSEGEISQQIFENQYQLKNTIVKAYSFMNEFVQFIKISVEDSTKLITSLGVVPGLEVINNAIGTRIVKASLLQYISEEDYKKWGIVGGEEGMNYLRSTFLLQDEDIVIIVNYKIKIPLLMDILEPISITQGVCVRAFTGNGNFESAFEKSNKEASELNEAQEVVYVTKNGQVYHQDRTCRYIDVKVFSTSYADVKDERICEVCAKDHVVLSDTSTVYSTVKSSIFHTNKACWTIVRDVSTLSREDALENGYRACSLCGGD